MPDKLHTENILFERIAEGDAKAFEILYKRFSDRLVAVAYNRVKDRQACQDIVHEAFLSLWKNRTKAEINNLENYLVTAVKYLAINYLVRGRTIYVSAAEQLPGMVTEENAETILHQKRLLQLIHEETNRLPEQCRIIFRYKHETGLSIKEIAHKMDISPRTVQTQLYIAMKKLRKLFKIVLFSFYR